MAKKKIRKHGEGTLFQRKDGRWQASFSPASGGKRRYVYGTTKKEALEKLRQAQEEDRKGILPTGPHQKLGDYLMHWLESTHRPPMARTSTYVNYRSIIIRHLIPAIGHIDVQKLTPQHVQALYAQKMKAGLKPRTIGVIHAILRGALENAVRWRLVSQNVASLASVPHPERYEGPVLTMSQVRKLIEMVRGGRMETVLILAVMTGMRRGEIMALRWTDIDFNKKLLYVRRTVNRYSGFGLVVNDPKTKTSRRKIKLADVVVEALQEHRKRQEEAQRQSDEKGNECGLVFPNTQGDFVDPNNVGRSFRRLLKKAGLPHMRFHDLRHSTATILLAMGVSLKVVQELLGHHTIAMTSDTYAYLLPSMQEDAMEQLDKKFRDDEEEDDDTGEQGKH
jgi:integrase